MKDSWNQLERQLDFDSVPEQELLCPKCGIELSKVGSPQVIVTGHRLRGFAPVALGQWCRCTKCNSRGIFDI